MTIAQAFNEIAVAQGGTASKSGSITGAIDALNDALAGSDQAPAQTIEDAVRLLGQNIGGGGGGGGTEYSIKCAELNDDTGELTEIESIAYYGVHNNENSYDPDMSKGVLTTAKAGEVIMLFTGEDYPSIAVVVASLDISDPDNEQFVNSYSAPLSHCPMPAHDCYFVTLAHASDD